MELFLFQINIHSGVIQPVIHTHQIHLRMVEQHMQLVMVDLGVVVMVHSEMKVEEVAEVGIQVEEVATGQVLGMRVHI